MAERELSKKLGEVEVDGLVTAIDPHIVIGAGVIRKAASSTLKLAPYPTLVKNQIMNTFFSVSSKVRVSSPV